MFFDIHVHVSKTPPQFSPGEPLLSTPAELIERYDRIGVEKAALLPVLSPEASVGIVQSNEEVIEIAREHPGRFIPFCSVDPRQITNDSSAPLGSILERYKALGCRGVGEVIANLPFLDSMVQNLFRHVQEAALPLTFHIAPRIGGAYGLYDDPGLPQLERSLQLFPRLKFLGHSQAFWAEIARLETPADRYGYPAGRVQEEGVVPKLLRRYGNLYGDLSAGSGANALSRDPEYAVRFLNEFQDRLLFGTDICAPTTPTPLVDFLLDLRDSGRIDGSVFVKIARGNAAALLGGERGSRATA